MSKALSELKIALIAKASPETCKVLAKDVATIESSGLFAQVKVYESLYAGHSVELARAACGEYDYLVAVGGDGTLHEVSNGCLSAKRENADLIIPAIGVLARGTANDFVKSLASKGSAAELVSQIKQGCVCNVDVGTLRYQNAEHETEHCYFLNVSSVGIGGMVAKKINKRNKLLGANVTFLSSIVETLINYKFDTLSVTSDEGLHWKGKTLALVAANAKYFGSGLCIAPDARLDDGRLNITLIGKVGVLDFASKLLDLKRERKVKHPQVQYHEARHIEVTSMGGPCALEADGEFIGYTPLTIGIAEQQLPVLMASPPQ